jgi:hypothetical protein
LCRRMPRRPRTGPSSDLKAEPCSGCGGSNTGPRDSDARSRCSSCEWQSPPARH